MLCSLYGACGGLNKRERRPDQLGLTRGLVSSKRGGVVGTLRA